MAEVNDNHRDDLAAEYVLGTLQGNARRQFEQLMRNDAEMRRRVRDWESRLFVLSDGVNEVKPPARVWRAIQARIKPQPHDLGRARLGWWRAWGLLASVMLVVLSVTTYQLQQPSEDLTPLVVLSDQSAQAGWLVKTDYDNKLILAQVLTVSDPGPDKAYELWMLPKGEAPRSLGLLPLQGQERIRLSDEKLTVLKRSDALAVSLEPAGGSPTGAPTGPVLYQGKVLEI